MRTGLRIEIIHAIPIQSNDLDPASQFFSPIMGNTRINNSDAPEVNQAGVKFRCVPVDQAAIIIDSDNAMGPINLLMMSRSP